jgi:CubicO group peptidase (beta-lactamase class C family)
MTFGSLKIDRARKGAALIPSEPLTTVHRTFDNAPRATLADWLTPPMNRWAFRHVRELMWTERVSAAPRGPLPKAESSSLISDEVLSYFEQSYTDAFVVLHEGQLVDEWYAPGVAIDDRHIVFSVTKSIVGIVASVLIAAGVLDDSAPVTAYIPEVAAGGYAAATVRDVLDMTADIRFTEDYDGEDMRLYREANGTAPAKDGGAGLHAFLVNLPQSGPHGRAFHYASPTAELAAWVCERASGLSLAELISQYIWQPIGAEHDADLLIDRYGASRGSGGFAATARDLARMGQLLIDAPSGPIRHGIADLKRPGDRDHWEAGTLRGFIPNGSYRDFWYQSADAPGIYLAAGIYGQRVYVDVIHHTVIVQQSSLPTSFDETTWQQTLPLFRGIVDIFRA